MKTLQDAELPQFTIKGFETNERKIKLATGTYQVHHASPNITFQKRQKGKNIINIMSSKSLNNQFVTILQHNTLSTFFISNKNYNAYFNLISLDFKLSK